MAIAIEDPAAAASGEWSARLDGYVERARVAAEALRELDQQSVDGIVWAMTVAGLEHAVDLAELAMEETADTGIDALTHALEAAVSIFASPFTDAFCMQAANLILGALPKAYVNGSDLEARTAMANAATIAGLAFSNAFVGLNHALRYNASLPSKFMPAPRYSAYVAPEKYAQIAWILGLGGKSEQDRRERLFARVEELLDEVHQPRSLAAASVPRDEFEAALPELAKLAFADPSIRTNPRIPLLREIVALLRLAYEG